MSVDNVELPNLSTEKTNGTRLRRLLLDNGTQALRKKLLGIHPLSSLSGVLTLNQVQLKKKCFPDQVDLLFPSVGQPDPGKYDITLLSRLLRDICSLSPPTKGWKNDPDASDRSIEANIVRITKFRNKIQHKPGSGVSDTEFEALWIELSQCLEKMGIDKNEMNRLKHDRIDQEEENNIEGRWNKMEQDVDKLKDDVEEIRDRLDQIQESTEIHIFWQLRSCIPDEPKNFIGRKKILDDIVKEEKPLILIHGMAGIGKSTLIKKASWELHNKHGKKMYYVNLWQCKSSEEEISQAILSGLGCRTSTQEPQQALKDSVRILKDEVVLVLDNVEDVLTEDRVFEKLLQDIRKFSNRNVRYIVATREVFDLEDLEKKEIMLEPLSVNEGLDVISVNLKCKDSNLSRKQGKLLAKLCFHNPLALCIVSSLLEDYKPDELIANLKSKPIDMLDGLKRAISVSFEKLEPTMIKFFVKLTEFAGSFTADYAVGVTVYEKLHVIKYLKELSRRNLLHNEIEKKKYIIHPFIHEFVIEYGNKHAIPELEEGKLNFINYYGSCLLDNSKLYLTKDRCKDALKNVFQDKNNYVKALEMFCSSELNDTKWGKSDLKFLIVLLTFLESCISWNLFDKLLDSFLVLTKKRKLVCRELEIICWKGHISRRKGDSDKYAKFVKESDTLFDENINSLRKDSTAFACYYDAKGRRQMYDDDRLDAIKTFEKVVEICQENKEDDPIMQVYYARAVEALGNNLKNLGYYDKALKKFHQSIDINVKHLGEHTHTAFGFKALSDCYLIKEDYETSLIYSDKALEMLKSFNNEEQMILFLKKRGICFRKLERYEESKKCLKRSEALANEHLEVDHKYKFWIKAELALLYEQINDMKQAQEVAFEAMEMGKRLQLSASDWRHYEKQLQLISNH